MHARRTSAISAAACFWIEAGWPSSHGQDTSTKPTIMPRPVTLFTGQWADLPLEKLAAARLRNGLRRPRTRLLGRPLRCRCRRHQQELREGEVGDALRPRAHLLRHFQPPRRPGRLRPDRRAPQGDSAARCLGRRRARGRSQARREENDHHRQGRARVLRRQARPRQDR